MYLGCCSKISQLEQTSTKEARSDCLSVNGNPFEKAKKDRERREQSGFMTNRENIRTNESCRRFNRSLSLFLIIACVSLTGCRSAVNNSNLSQVEYGRTNPSASIQTAEAAACNMAHEQAVADGCLKAWRTAVAGDENAAMAQLTELDKKHPDISTVQFMMGQVKEHFKKDKEAVFHYQKAMAVNEFSSMQSYKLAESMRRSGDAKGSIVYYEKLEKNLESATGEHGRDQFSQLLDSVRLGLAKALIASGDNKERARAVVDKVLATTPENKEAKGLLKELQAK